MLIRLGIRKADVELPGPQHLLSILIDRVADLNSNCGTIASKDAPRSCRPIFSVLLIYTFAPPFSPPGAEINKEDIRPGPMQASPYSIHKNKIEQR